MLGGMYSGVHVIDDSYKVTELCSVDGSVTGIVYGGRIYTLIVSNSVYNVNVFDMSGNLITSWYHHNSGYRINQLTVINNQIVIPHHNNKQLIIYSLNGETVKSIPCSLLDNINNYTHICNADNTSVVISNPTKVFKVDTATGVIIWRSTQILNSRGVTCYRSKHVLVAGYRVIHMLDIHTGIL